MGHRDGGDMWSSMWLVLTIMASVVCAWPLVQLWIGDAREWYWFLGGSLHCGDVMRVGMSSDDYGALWLLTCNYSMLLILLRCVLYVRIDLLL